MMRLINQNAYRAWVYHNHQATVALARPLGLNVFLRIKRRYHAWCAAKLRRYVYPWETKRR